MNAKKLFKAIGDIDDKYIIDADKKINNNLVSKYYKWGLLAVSILIFIVTINIGSGNDIRINDLTKMESRMEKVYRNESMKKDYDYDGINRYFNNTIPKVLLNDMDLIDSNFSIYLDKDGEMLYDLIMLNYRDTSITNKIDERHITIYASKLGITKGYLYVGMDKVSKINDIEIYIGKYDVRNYVQMHIGIFKYNGVDYTVIGKEMTDEEFIQVLKEIK